MNFVDLIIKKRDKKVLTNEEIEFFIKGVCDDSIPDYQISAMLMAIFCNGLNTEETSKLTLDMANNGYVLDLSEIDGVKVDKHSTGGVADTTTLILAPLVASCGVPCVKMSGRGLGFTGGTLDKLESIENFNIYVSDKDVIKFGKESNIVVMGQSDNLTPADKKLYGLRDVTGTVDNIPLIAGSIMSKKIAAGADAIVLDVKCGQGGFMKNLDDAKALANAMVSIGKAVGRQCMAVITNMNQPLGNNIGNSLEVIEAIEVLKGEIKDGDLLEVSLTLGANMLVLAGKTNDIESGKKLLLSKIENGEGLKKFQQLIAQQSGNTKVLEDYSLFKQCSDTKDLVATKDGYIGNINSEEIGKSCVLLGAGRKTKTDKLDLGAGIIMKKRLGDKVSKGDVICSFYADGMEKINQAIPLVESAITFTNEKPKKEPLILDIVK